MALWVRELDLEIEDKVLFSHKVYHRIYELLQELSCSEGGAQSPVLRSYIKDFSALVPYRLISPWFAGELRGLADSKKNEVISGLSRDTKYKSLYSIENKDSLKLVIDDDWAEYLNENYAIVNGWWRSEFIHYLQKRNPTVLGLSMKLDPPISRNMNSVKKCFQKYYQLGGTDIRCFYTDKLIEGSISHDHFLPWSFMGDDPIHNFVPTSKELNSSKSNSIPPMSFMSKLSSFQFKVFNHCKKHHSSLSEAYMNDLHIEANTTEDLFKKSMEKYYKPLFLSAKNQGFSQSWRPGK